MIIAIKSARLNTPLFIANEANGNLGNALGVSNQKTVTMFYHVALSCLAVKFGSTEALVPATNIASMIAVEPLAVGEDIHALTKKSKKTE